MQIQSTWVFSVKSTLGKIETTPQIGEILEKGCENAILKLIISASTKKWLHDQNYTHMGQEYRLKSKPLLEVI